MEQKIIKAILGPGKNSGPVQSRSMYESTEQDLLVVNKQSISSSLVPADAEQADEDHTAAQLKKVNLSDDEEGSVPARTGTLIDQETAEPIIKKPALPTPGAVVGGRRGAELSHIDRKNWLIHAHYARGELTQTKSLIKEALEESDNYCEYASYVQALILREEGKIEESFEALQQCALLSPENALYVKQIGRSFFLMGKHRQAIDVLGKASVIDAQDWEVYYWTAMSFHQLGEREKTKEMLMKSLEISRQERSLCLMAELCEEAGDGLLAAECYRKCIELAPDNIDVQTKLGLLYLRTGSFQQAFEALGRALSNDPENSCAILAAGSMMQKYGDHDVAISKYRLAATLTPDSAQLWSNIGMCFYGKGKLVAAVSCLKRANYLAPLDWKIQYNLGLVHLGLLQYASAFHFMSAAVNLQPNSAMAFMTLAVILTYLDDVPNATAAYERALSLDDVDPVIALNFAIFKRKQNDLAAARQFLEMYKERERKYSQKLPVETKETADHLNNELQKSEHEPAAPVESSHPPSTAQTMLSAAETLQQRLGTSGSTGSAGSGLSQDDGIKREDSENWRMGGDNASMKTMSSRHVTRMGSQSPTHTADV